MRQDVAEYFCSELLALIMSNHAYLYFLIMSEILVIVHLAGNKGICLFTDCIVEKKVSSAYT